MSIPKGFDDCTDISEKHDCFVVLDIDMNDRICSECNLPEDLDYLKEVLASPDKYWVEFRQGTVCSGYTYKQAYELAKSHPDDYFEVVDWIIYGVDYKSDQFINERILSYIAEMEELEDWDGEFIPFSYGSWDEESDAFVWDRVLDEDEIKVLKNKYGIQ